MAFLKMAFNQHGDLKGRTVNGSDSVIQETINVHCYQCNMGGTLILANAFCTSCFDFLCEKCEIGHRQSCTVHGAITNDLGQCGAFIGLIKKISLAKQEVVQTENEAECNIRLAEQYRDNALKTVKEKREDINRMLEEQKAKIDNELDDLETEINDKITEKYTAEYQKFQAIISDTKALRTKLEDITPKKNDKKFFKKLAVSEQEMTKIKPKIRQAGAHNEVTKFRFEPNPEQNCTIQMATTKLGTIMTLDTTKASAAVNHILDVNVTSPGETESCSIKGMCFMSKHLLVIADSQNNLLKVVKRENSQVVSAIAMPTGPRDVTKVKHNQIAVTLPRSKKIQILSMKKSQILSRSHEITVDGICQGIVYDNGKLVVSFNFPSHIQILDMNGVLLHKIDSVKTLDGTSSYAGIGVSPNHEMIYVADEDQGTVTLMTMKGKVKAVYRNMHFQTPRALAVDCNGFVYVSGKARVHKLSPDLSHGTIVLDHSHDIKYVQSLMPCEDQNTLYVGMLYEDKIKVFEIM